MNDRFLIYKRIDREFWTYGRATAKSLAAVVGDCLRAYPGQPVMIEDEATGSRMVVEPDAAPLIVNLLMRARTSLDPYDRAPEAVA